MPNQDGSRRVPISVIAWADPGFIDGQPRIPMGSRDEIQDGWDYMRTASEYADDQTARIRQALRAAGSRLRLTLTD